MRDLVLGSSSRKVMAVSLLLGLMFTGGMDGDRMILRGGNPANRTRMIFADIQDDSLTWHWAIL